MHIEKTARQIQNFSRPYRTFRNARSGFKAFMSSVRFASGEKVLLPAYIGWSPREGSGVFDPIRELGVQHGFYRVDERLHLDLAHLEELLRVGNIRLVVLIHYFGYVDPNARVAALLARRFGAQVLEDEAHAMYTDLVMGASGRFGDACIFSLHKMLPVNRGGMLIGLGGIKFLHGKESKDPDIPLPWDYDLFAIARCRVENAQTLEALLKPLAGAIDPLWPLWPSDNVPQTFPVVVRRVSRDDLYGRMNEAGYGVVSLYHTMVSEISAEAYPASHRLSRCVMNLPVHQDVTPDTLQDMVKMLARCVDDLCGVPA